MKIYGEKGSSFFKDGKYYTFNAKGFLDFEEIKEESIELDSESIEDSQEEIKEESIEIKKPNLKSKKK